MEKLLSPFRKYREQLAYLFFGAVTTAVNIAIYAGLHTALGVPSDIANAAAWVAGVVVAYLTNRRWVFHSHTRGRAMLREALSFLGGRVLTGAMDMAIMHVGVEILGPRLISDAGRRLWDLGVKAF